MTVTDTIFTSQTPTGNGSGGGPANRTIGMRWQSSTSGRSITSGRYLVPDEGLGSTALYQIWDGSSRLINVDMTTLPWVAGQWLDIPYGSLFTPTGVHDYFVGAHLDGAQHYRFSSGQTLPVGSGGTVIASVAGFGEDRGPDLPPNDFTFSTGFFFVDVNSELPFTPTPSLFVGGIARRAALGLRLLARAVFGRPVPEVDDGEPTPDPVTWAVGKPTGAWRTGEPGPGWTTREPRSTWDTDKPRGV